MQAIWQFIVKHLFGHITAKLLALALAVAVWLFAYTSSSTQEEFKDVPVRVSVKAEGWTVSNASKLTASVQLTYPRTSADKLSKEISRGLVFLDAEVMPDKDDSDVQTKILSLRANDLIASRDIGLHVDRIDPAEMPVELVRETTKNLPVVPRLSAPPPGYEVTYTYAIPSTIAVRGRKDVIARATGIETAEIDISAPPPANPPVWTISVAAVRVTPYVTVDNTQYPVIVADQRIDQCGIVLNQKADERKFPDVRIGLLVPPEYKRVAEIKPQAQATTSVIIRGPKLVVDAVKRENVILYVDLTDPGLIPKDVPYTQRVVAQIINTPRAGELTIVPEKSEVPVQINEPPAPK